MNIQKTLKFILSGISIFFISGQALSFNSEQILVDKSEFSAYKGFPEIASTSLNHFNEQFPIKIIEDSQLNEAAQASRAYTIYSQTDECIITVNFKFHLAHSIAKISSTTLKTFVYLHEIAHCADGEPEPEGVDKDEWLESLADGYAAGIMLQNNLINQSQLTGMKNYRRNHSNNGAAKMNEYLMNDMPTTWKTLSEEEMLQKIKNIRRKIFKK